MHTAGVILDIYDDLKGRILREKVASSGVDLPEMLKTAALLAPDELARVPDRLFALVAQNGDQVLRKYAMHDSNHLATSILYFLECGHVLPEEAQKLAAENMVNACSWYDFEPPLPLVKRAFLGKALGALGMVGALKDGNQQRKADNQAFQQAQAAAAMPKIADLNGTSAMPNTGMLSTKVPPGRVRAVQTKTAQMLDLTQLEAPVQAPREAHTRFALEGRYPLDTEGQTKQAAAYFEEYWGHFVPEDRYLFACNLVKRASELGVGLPPEARAHAYASTTQGTKLAGELVARKAIFEGTPHEEGYTELLSKVASYGPVSLARELETLDRASGAETLWGSGRLLDPYRAVFEAPKVASALTIDRDALHHLAVHGVARVVETLGEKTASALRRDPEGTYRELPELQQQVLRRLTSL